MSDICKEHSALCVEIENLTKRIDEFVVGEKERMDRQENQGKKDMEAIHERINRKEEDRLKAEERIERKLDGVIEQVGALKEYMHRTIQRTLTWLLIFVGGGVVTWVITQVVRLTIESGAKP